MTASPFSLVVACLLLWIPFTSTLVQRREDRVSRLSRSPSAKSLLLFWPNWVDLIRSFLAIGLLVTWGGHVIEDTPAAAKILYPLYLGIVLVAFFVQVALVHSGHYVFTPLPLFVACGFWIPGLELGAFAVVAAWAISFALDKFEALLMVLALTLFLGGMVLNADLLKLALSIGLVAFPHVFALMFSRQIAMPAKNLPQA